jgi:hypothetical protein
MDCWHCRRTAVGACRFCGRGLCEDHVRSMPFVISLYGHEPSSVARVARAPTPSSFPS